MHRCNLGVRDIFWDSPALARKDYLLLVLGVPRPGCLKPGCLQNFTQRSFALFCALLCSCALLCGLALCSFALIYVLLCSFTCFCVRPRLERPRLGTANSLVDFRGKTGIRALYQAIGIPSPDFIELIPWRRHFNTEPFRSKLLRSLPAQCSQNPSLANHYLGRTPKGSYSPRGRSRHLLETPFSGNPLLRTLFYCKAHSRPPSQNPAENSCPKSFPKSFPEPFSERCVECCVAVHDLGGSQWGWCRWGRSDFPLFYACFPFFLRIFPLFLRFSLLLLKDKGKQQQFTAKMRNFTQTPSAPTPCKTSRMTP